MHLDERDGDDAEPGIREESACHVIGAHALHQDERTGGFTHVRDGDRDPSARRRYRAQPRGAVAGCSVSSSTEQERKSSTMRWNSVAS